MFCKATIYVRSRSCNTGQNIDTVIETSHSSDTRCYTLWSPGSHFQPGYTCPDTRGWQHHYSVPPPHVRLQAPHSLHEYHVHWLKPPPPPHPIAVPILIYAHQANLIVRLMWMQQKSFPSYEPFYHIKLYENLQIVFLYILKCCYTTVDLMDRLIEFRW